MELEIVRVESLLLHERILPHLVERLVLEFENWANLENPVIVDKNHIVLDGNHRTYVFKKLDFKYIPVCRIDYSDCSAQLRYWFRVIGNLKSVDDLKRTIAELGGKVQQVKDKEALKAALEKNCLCCGIQHGEFFALIMFSENLVCDAVGAYDALEKLQHLLVEKGMKVDYIPCQQVSEGRFCEGLDESQMVIWTPQITKEMVVDAVKRERVFAPKTTRHLIPARPLNVNVPTRWLKEDVSLEVINERFSDYLKSKEMRRLGPGQVVNGRYYEEELFVFYDKKR
jgi:L-serine kinase (ADP)